MDETTASLNPLAVEWLGRHQSATRLDLALLTEACRLVAAIGEQKPPYSASLCQQGLLMADELIVLNCDSHTIAAGIIFPALYYQKPADDLIEKYLPADVYTLAQGVRKMDAVQQMRQEKSGGRADNLRKMCLAMVDDVRIVLIKLAEQLVILKYLRHCSAQQQQLIASQVRDIYAPLANRLGVGHLKWQLEDLALRYLQPTEYREISQALKMRRQDREIFIKNFMQELRHLMQEFGVDGAEISGRAKHIYSIYRKIERKRVDFSQIYDTSAVRILVKTIEDCYKALSIVHTTWRHLASEFDDYIAKPKPNGYRSIHTVVLSSENIHVEIQIRTFQMHEESELGVAAHWQYKEGSGKASNYAEKINWLRHIMDWQKEVATPQDNLYHKIFEDRVYVFTPNGDVVDLEAGATPLDFAYHVHSELGHRCRGAKVNDMIVPLTYPLRTGDQISIIAGKENNPSRDWLNPASRYLKTSAALQKVRSWFKRQEQQHYFALGESQWEKLARREGVSKNEVDKALAYFKFKNTDELFIAIGSGVLGAISVLNKIKHPEADESKKETILEKPVEKPLSSAGELQIEGVSNLLTQLAHCCRPIPGDAILGYITKARGITIHQQHCRNIQFTRKRHPERLFQVTWGSQVSQSYQVEIRIEAEDRAGLIRDISNVIAAEQVNLLGLNSRLDKLENRAFISLTVEVKSLPPLKKILQQLQQVPSVTFVQRV
jgi:GTP pyrophosphokinase